MLYNICLNYVKTQSNRKYLYVLIQESCVIPVKKVLIKVLKKTVTTKTKKAFSCLTIDWPKLNSILQLDYDAGNQEVKGSNSVIVNRVKCKQCYYTFLKKLK